MDALRKYGLLVKNKICKEKSKMDLIVIRINKSGNLCESAPCINCTKEIAESTIVKINNLYFSRADGSITCVKFTEWLKFGTPCTSKGWKHIQAMNCKKQK